MTKYQNAKLMLRSHAEFVKALHRKDKPMIRQSINDYTDSICKDFRLTDRQTDLLSNFAAKLHPKD